MISVAVKALALGVIGVQRRYRARGALSLFVAVSLLVEVADYLALRASHFSTSTVIYRRTYFAADAVVAVVGYIVLVRLLELAFEQSPLRLPRLRSVAMLVFSGIAVCSAALLYNDRGSFAVMRFSVEMEQMLAFLAMLLAMLLFVGVNLVRMPGVRFRRVILAFSILYSAKAIGWALLDLFPHPALVQVGIPLLAIGGLCWLTYSVIAGESSSTALARAPVHGTVEAEAAA